MHTAYLYAYIFIHIRIYIYIHGCIKKKKKKYSFISIDYWKFHLRFFASHRSFEIWQKKLSKRRKKKEEKQTSELFYLKPKNNYFVLLNISEWDPNENNIKLFTGLIRYFPYQRTQLTTHTHIHTYIYIDIYFSLAQSYHCGAPTSH